MARLLFIICISFLAGCNSLPEAERVHKDLSGNWIMLYPDHQLENQRQRVLYSQMQDSIVGLSALKLITLANDGSFAEIDSLQVTGHWGISPDKIFFISGGGKGFQDFSGQLTSLEGGKLKVTQLLRQQGETIKLVWHLKKISGADARLFRPEANNWRIPATTDESEQQIRHRLSEMLKYYADYYSLVTAESSFFVPTRVLLPLRFYQHAIGLKEFDGDSHFTRLFHDRQQAIFAYKLLSNTIKLLRDDFPSRDNYVKEYAAFMSMMAKSLSPE
jgi:hypothetical protein